MRKLSIIAYFFIFLQGSMIRIPLGVLLVTGLFDAEPIMKILIALADLSLISLVVISFNDNTKTSLVVQITSYFLLLLPLLKIVSSFPLEKFDYFLFLFPAAFFVLTFPLSIVLSYRKYKRQVKIIPEGLQ